MALGFRIVSFTLTVTLCLQLLTSAEARIIKVIAENDVIEIDIGEGERDIDNHEVAGMVVEDDNKLLQWMGGEDSKISSSDEDKSDDVDDIWLARKCDPKQCKLPDCRCSGPDIPGDLKPTKTPQMILLSFSNAVRQQDSQLYDKLFANRTNPNGCPATGTFFVSHNYSDYYEVQRLSSKRHEVADNAVSEVVPEFWRTATCKQWSSQISDQKKILSAFGHVAAGDIRGFRSPFLYVGGNNMYCGERSAGIKYDATRVQLDSDTHGKGFFWPYTYDYSSTQPCVSGVCPNNTFPGLWQIPLAALTDAVGNPCSDLGDCVVSNEDQAYNMLRNGFQDHYTTNRSPMMLQMNVNWLQTNFKLAAMGRFLDMLADYKDVYVVSAWQALKWVQKPTSVKNPPPFRCSTPPPSVCKESETVTCYFDKDRHNIKPGTPGIQFVMRMCNGPCPKCYPAVGDPTGSSC